MLGVEPMQMYASRPKIACENTNRHGDDRGQYGRKYCAGSKLLLRARSRSSPAPPFAHLRRDVSRALDRTHRHEPLDRLHRRMRPYDIRNLLLYDRRKPRVLRYSRIECALVALARDAARVMRLDLCAKCPRQLAYKCCACSRRYVLLDR